MIRRGKLEGRKFREGANPEDLETLVNLLSANEWTSPNGGGN